VVRTASGMVPVACGGFVFCLSLVWRCLFGMVVGSMLFGGIILFPLCLWFQMRFLFNLMCMVLRSFLSCVDQIFYLMGVFWIRSSSS